MAKFHFVEDYERLVDQLIGAHPIDEAMSIAVGGNYELLGHIELAALKQAGLAEKMDILDLGCGSGRLANALHIAGIDVQYTGIDIIQVFLDYAQSKAPKYKFILNKSLQLPLADDSTDMVCAFSLFTHLLHAESYLYLEECKRILRPGGKIVFSFLEFSEPHHWGVFEHTKAMTAQQTTGHLNMFIERNAIKVWVDRLGLNFDSFINADQPLWMSHPLGQSIAILSKPAH